MRHPSFRTSQQPAPLPVSRQKSHILVISNPVKFNPADSGATIMPLLSELVNRIQFGGDEVVKVKDGAGSATVSMAYASAKFTNSLLRGLNGEKGVITRTFVKSPLFADQGVDFVSSNVELGVRQIVSRF